MSGHLLAQTILSGVGGLLAASVPLLVFCGFLRPLRWRARVEPRPATPPGPVPSPAMRLNTIELALIAEFGLERARDHDEVANDPAQDPEVRRLAAANADAWRERARAFQLQAKRQGSEPVVPHAVSSDGDGAYTGPERRRRPRRRHTRRAEPEAAAPGLEGGERRARPDRRRGDRRRPQLAAR